MACGGAFGPSVEATFVPGSPARQGWLALWGEGAPGAGTELVLVHQTGSRVRRRTTRVAQAELTSVIEPLATLSASEETTASLRAWATATQVAVDLVARGRLLPGISADGHDQWRVGPLDLEDRARLAQLADALPPSAHALTVAGTSPARVTDPHDAVRGFLDAVADTFVRTAAAADHAGFAAFAAPGGEDPSDVSAQRAWLESATASEGALLAALRVEPPVGDDAPVSAVLQAQSAVDSGLVLDAGDLWAAPPSLLARFGQAPDEELLLTLRRASQVFAPVRRLLDQTHPEQLVLEDEEVEQLFGPVADDLRTAGLPVLWPREVLAPLEMRPVVSTPRPTAVSPSGMHLDALGEMRWRATVDGAELDERELTLLAEAKRPMVRVRGRFVRADPARLAKLGERRTVRTGEVLSAALSGSLLVDGTELEPELDPNLEALALRLRADPRTVEPPHDLEATLRPYQRRGVSWLAEMAELGLGGVLADDMGLGKTVQVLALGLIRRQRGPTLIVCPATLIGNWEREAQRFAPSLAVRRYHGTNRALDRLEPGELVITTYGVVRRDAAALAGRGWNLVVADEAQAVKNPLARTAKALRSIPAQARLALTGTPVENRLADLWALLDWTTPGLLGSLDGFQQHVATPIERDRDAARAARLAATVGPFLLRRRKSDPEIAPDLPPKTETDRFVGLTTEQATLYRAVVAELLGDVSRADGIDRRGLVFKLLSALKQICNHPAQYLGQQAPLAGRSAKLDTTTDLLRVIVDEGDAALVFTQFVAMGELLTGHLAGSGIGVQFLHGGVPVRRRDHMVARFQAGEVPVFVVSLKAGGTGLNLTAATHVVHYDRWWNPAVEDQASDRAWRIGQDRPVQIHRLICEGTLEERIALLLEDKRELAEAVVGGGEMWLSELSDAELADLVRLAVP